MMTVKVNSELEKMKEKLDKSIGMKAYNKTDKALFGKTARVEGYEIEETGDEKMPFRVTFILSYETGEKLHSHGEDTVILIDSQK
mgnify:CR=1 FL=1